jgi:ssDNA-binding Zn-finger/Zn-ribbon topoisomerase 1
MKINSEKEMYGSRLHEEVINFNAEYFVWGEELLDKKLFLYSKKLKQVPGYYEIKDVLKPCGLVIVNVSRKKYLRCASAMLDTERGNLYMAEATFNSIWRDLKRSVDLGIRIARQEEKLCPIQNPEEIVVLDYLVRQNSYPVIEEDILHYRHRELTNEEKQLHSRKQSLLDNPQMFYYFSETGRYYHDQDCIFVKEILPEQFHASETIPEDKEICPKCRRLIYFRKATYPNAKQSGICNRIFLNRWVSNSRISHYTMDIGMKFHATTLDEMRVEYGEDTWIIKGLDTDMLSLWHNNYVKTSETERYITEGFHNQNADRKQLSVVLDYIESYSWQKHLEHENDKLIGQDVEYVAEESVENDSESSASGTTDKKRTWYQIFVDWVRKLI